MWHCNSAAIGADRDETAVAAERRLGHHLPLQLDRVEPSAPAHVRDLRAAKIIARCQELAIAAIPAIVFGVAPKHDATMSAIRSALHDPPEEMNDHERKIVANVRETGWQGTHVFPGEESPGFSYSTGFWVTAGIPEILTCSLPSNVAHSILRYILEKADSGFVPPIGVAVSDVMVGYDCYFFPIRKEGYEEYPLSSNWFYHGFDYPCLQLVWADEAGLFPWQPGFNEAFRDDQPDLSPDGWLSHLAN